MTEPTNDYDHVTGDWGFLEKEPCRFCRESGGVYFQNDERPLGIFQNQAMRCEKCKRTWTADSALA